MALSAHLGAAGESLTGPAQRALWPGLPCGQDGGLLAPEAIGPLFPHSLRKGLRDQVVPCPTNTLSHGPCLANIKSLPPKRI